MAMPPALRRRSRRTDDDPHVQRVASQGFCFAGKDAEAKRYPIPPASSICGLADHDGATRFR
jgi:hypothetical protein